MAPTDKAQPATQPAVSFQIARAVYQCGRRQIARDITLQQIPGEDTNGRFRRAAREVARLVRGKSGEECVGGAQFLDLLRPSSPAQTPSPQFPEYPTVVSEGGAMRSPAANRLILHADPGTPFEAVDQLVRSFAARIFYFDPRVNAYHVEFPLQKPTPGPGDVTMATAWRKLSDLRGRSPVQGVLEYPADSK